MINTIKWNVIKKPVPTKITVQVHLRLKSIQNVYIYKYICRYTTRIQYPKTLCVYKFNNEIKFQ